MQITFRLATLEDIDDLMAIEEASFTEDIDRFGRRQFRYLLAKGHDDIIIATSGNETVGFAVLLYRAHSPTARGWSLAVRPDFREHGVTTALFAWANHHMRAKGIAHVNFEVRADNEGARRLYEGLGFREIAYLPDHFGPGMDGIRMRSDVSRG